MPKLSRVSGIALRNIDFCDQGTLFDTFLSLHLPTAPHTVIYVTECVSLTTNPSFGPVSIPSETLLLHKFKLKVWTRPSTSSEPWHLYTSGIVDINSLVPCKADKLDIFSTDAVVVKIDDTWHTHPKCLVKLNKTTRSNSRSKTSISYAFDTLRHILNLSSALSELSASKCKVSNQIVDQANSIKSTPHIDILAIAKAVSKQKSINDGVLSKIVAMKININKVHQILDDDFPIIQEMASNRSEIIDSSIEPLSEALLASVYPSYIERLKELVGVVQHMIVIDNVPNSLRYTIMGIEFPLSIRDILQKCYDAEKNSHTIVEVNAGLSYIAQLIQCLALITDTHLKYKIVCQGNESYLIDNISKTTTSYPLSYDPEQTTDHGIDYRDSTHAKHVMKNEAFEQGLNLLNKNLVLLINNVTEIYKVYYRANNESHHISDNIPLDCLDNFLWNLQYLMLFMTADIDLKKDGHGIRNGH